jgi:hypothetical protein
MSAKSPLEQASEKIEKKLAERLVKEALAAEKFVDPDEMFANWLPIKMGYSGTRRTFDFTLEDLNKIRDMARILCASDEVCINVIKHYQNNVVGDGITCSILPKEMTDDPKKIADALKDKKILKMQRNWDAFCQVNKLDDRLRDWVKRAHRDGEVLVRLFNSRTKYAGLKVPEIRFIDPGFIKTASDAPLGVFLDPEDAESITGYNFDTTGAMPVDMSKSKPSKFVELKPDTIIHDKRNVDSETPRGLSSFWAVFTNIRRCSKNMENVSVLTSILSAIALVRKHSQATQSKIDKFLSQNSDGKNRTNQVSGKTQYARHMEAGTVIDAPMGTEYDFPAHTVQSKNYIEVIDKELAMIALSFVLPVEWLKASTPDTEIGHTSPVVKNFYTEQAILFEHITRLFWMVQTMMGVPEEWMLDYECKFYGPVIAVGNALDQARTNEIELRSGALSPQTWCAMQGRNYWQERANMIKHRQTAQPGEVMPGDAGNTNVTNDQKSAGQGGDGVSKSGNNSQRGGAGTPSKGE